MRHRFAIIAISSIVSLFSACIFGGSSVKNNQTNNDPDPELCGNGRIDPGETCDGNCGSCEREGCTIWAQVGSAEECDLRCEPTGEQTACGGGDTCCPEGCTEANDSDCSDECGDGIVGASELCDPCPEACEDNPCAPVIQSGDKSTCDLVCERLPDPVGCCGGDLCPDGSVCNPNDECVEPGCAEDSDCPGGEVCVQGLCTRAAGCDESADCELWELCTFEGHCEAADNCELARDPAAWCAWDSFEPGTQGYECNPQSASPPVCERYIPSECGNQGDCYPWERCQASDGSVDCSNNMCTCQIPRFCSEAGNPDVYCRVQESRTDAVCGSEMCL